MTFRKVVLDAEANSLDPDVVHCIVVKDIKTKEVFKFVQDECYDLFPDFMYREVRHMIGHNLIGFDIPKIFVNLLELDMSKFGVTDTLILSQLLYPDRHDFWFKWWQKEHKGETFPQLFKKPKEGGSPHSIAAWGLRIGRYKPEYENWEVYTPEMLHRCVEDVHINHEAYNLMLEEAGDFDPESVFLEHDVAFIIRRQMQFGVFISEENAKHMYTECKAISEKLSEKLSKAFPPMVKNAGEVALAYRKTKVDTGQTEINPSTGRRRKVYEEGSELSTRNLGWFAKMGDEYSDEELRELVAGGFTRVFFPPFNPNSSDQARAVLDAAGWKPVNFNKLTEKQKEQGRTQGNAKVSDEENLATIPASAPQAIKDIGILWMCNQRYKLAQTWLEQRDENSRLHGTIFSIGTPTARMRHKDPNTANIPGVSHDKETGAPKMGVEGKFGYEARACFSVPPGKKMVGIDASGLELRMLAHYMDDPEYTEEVVSGDIHTKNQEAAGLPTRDLAKTFIYGFLYGAGQHKIGLITGIPEEERERLEEQAKYTINEEYIIDNFQKQGLELNIENVMLHLKGGELKRKFLANIPALANVIDTVKAEAEQGWIRGLDGRKLWVRYPHAALNTLLQAAGAIVMKKALVIFDEWLQASGLPAEFVLNVHDEWQLEVDEDYANAVGDLGVKAIREAGKQLNMNVPLDGEYKVGDTWASTH